MMEDWGAVWTILAFLAWGMAWRWEGKHETRSYLLRWCDTHSLTEDTRFAKGYNEALEAVRNSVYRLRIKLETTKEGEI